MHQLLVQIRAGDQGHCSGRENVTRDISSFRQSVRYLAKKAWVF
jgi:hypothetical protein